MSWEWDDLLSNKNPFKTHLMRFIQVDIFFLLRQCCKTIKKQIKLRVQVKFMLVTNKNKKAKQNEKIK